MTDHFAQPPEGAKLLRSVLMEIDMAMKKKPTKGKAERKAAVHAPVPDNLFEALNQFKPKSASAADLESFAKKLKVEADDLEGRGHGGLVAANLRRVSIGSALLHHPDRPAKRKGRLDWEKRVAKAIGYEEDDARTIRSLIKIAEDVEVLESAKLENSFPIATLDCWGTRVRSSIRAAAVKVKPDIFPRKERKPRPGGARVRIAKALTKLVDLAESAGEGLWFWVHVQDQVLARRPMERVSASTDTDGQHASPGPNGPHARGPEPVTKKGVVTTSTSAPTAAAPATKGPDLQHLAAGTRVEILKDTQMGSSGKTIGKCADGKGYYVNLEPDSKRYFARISTYGKSWKLVDAPPAAS